MSDHHVLSSPMPVLGNRAVLTTPTGTQSMQVLRRRRLTMLLLNVLTYALLMWGVGVVLSAGGWTATSAPRRR